MRVLVAAAILLAAPVDPDPSECELFKPRPEAANCLSCHQQQRTHPIDVDYAQAAGANPELRSPQEVIRRGVFLPQGQVRCVTCHDARSPWKDRIALPPGSAVKPAANPFDRRTYEGPPLPAPQPGEAVAAKPLCLACHVID